MRPLFDDFDEFAFGDSKAVSRILREQQREERRYASRKPYSPGDEDYLDDMDGYDDYEEDSEYNEDEFDEHSGLDTDH